MKVKDLKRLCNQFDDETEVLCQVVDQQGNAWNMFFDLTKARGNNNLAALTVSHPTLKLLPSIKNDS